MKKMTLFGHLKDYINTKWDWDIPSDQVTFSTKDMRKLIGHNERLTFWKKYNKNPNYVLHCYLGELHTLGCITRIKHGKYKINAPIPAWFGSFHFKGLRGELNDKSNLYWNSLPSDQKVNPWAERKQNRIEDALGGWPHVEPSNQTIEQRIAAMEERVNEQTEKLQSIKNALIELQALADEQNQVELRHMTETVRRIHEVTYLGDEYRVIHTYNADDIYDESWKVDNYVDNEITNTEIADYLIDWVKQNCK